MNYSDLLIAELKREAQATRRVLERVPEDKLSWKPHEKSMSLGQLALHTASVIGGVAELLNESPREVPDVPLSEAASLGEILSALDKYAAIAENKLLAWGEAGLMETWTLTREGVPVIQVPRMEMVRTIMLNHWYHHRGQLTVYLRLLGVPLPGIYGPSADEF
ncbi:DinB family protein [Paenibacillus alkalitolerans]|uniref:DinB family protein n=1 Tax=Paenibacillus alkalitolerans TaxID=2799335 RepID=UPI0018F6871A|nr:DinB family protein [Paenibacillus alkalitolerans]